MGHVWIICMKMTALGKNNRSNDCFYPRAYMVSGSRTAYKQNLPEGKFCLVLVNILFNFQYPLLLFAFQQKIPS